MFYLMLFINVIFFPFFLCSRVELDEHGGKGSLDFSDVSESHLIDSHASSITCNIPKAFFPK